MRGLFDLQDASSSRMALAVEQLVSGSGFLYRGISFHRDGDVPRCDAVSPWHSPGLRDAEALALIKEAADVLRELVAASASFAEAVRPLTCRFAVTEDWDIMSMPVVELVDEHLVWKKYTPFG